MFVVMAPSATEAEILGVKSQILGEGLTPYDHAGAERVVIAVVGSIGPRKPELISRFSALPGVEAVTPISRPFKLTSREFHPEDTVIRVLDAVIGDGSLTIMAGPCSVETRDQLLETADAVAAHGGTVLRGGAFKPRTSPYSFQGLGVEGLRYLAEARDRTGLPVITEVMEPNQVDIVAEYADILQIGTRNMQNYSLLMAAGRVARPIMLKRGYGATVEELLMAAEYIVSAGNPNVILCERGIRTFETYTRNTMDLAAVPLLHQLTHLPVIVDPSHATGKRWLVKPLAIGGVAVGADATNSDFSVFVDPPTMAICPGSPVLYTVSLVPLTDFSESVTLSASGNPAGTTAVFSQNPVTPPGESNLTIGGAGLATPGSYTIAVTGLATTHTHSTNVGLDILFPAPGQTPALVAPANGATNIPVLPTFSWNAVTNASRYNLDVATDAAFNTIVYSQIITSGTSHTAETPLLNGTQYFWRITAENACGSSPASPTFSFTTFQPTQPVPNVTVSPGSFNVIVQPGVPSSQILNIGNSGTAVLTYTLVESASGNCVGTGNIVWLLLSNNAGSIPSGQSVNITLTFNPGNLQPGQYSGAICLASNDPDTSLINIPVAMTIVVERELFQLYLPSVLK